MHISELDFVLILVWVGVVIGVIVSLNKPDLSGIHETLKSIDNTLSSIQMTLDAHEAEREEKGLLPH